jgi:threonine dehydrogenase-like Zn-dependent dehydrogenase
VTIVGAYPGVVSVDLQDVMMRELALVGVRVYSAEDVLSAMTVVTSDGSDLGRLVTAVLPLAEGPSAISALRSGSELKVLLKGPAA